MMEPEPEIWVPVQASYANNTMFFLFFWTKCSGAGAKNLKMLEPEPKKLDARSWSRSLKFEYRLHSPGSRSVVITFFGPWTIFSKKMSNGSLCFADTS